MNAVAKIEPRRSVIATLADSYGMEAAAFEATLRGTVFPASGTREEFAAFALIAKEYRLNPLLREIYAFPKKGGGIVPIVGIDGWLNLINTHAQYDGMETDYVDDEKGNLVAVTCKIYRKDRKHPTIVTEYLDECIRSTEPWRMKRRMLRHKAAMQCARYAFGFSGIYDEDEAHDIAITRDVSAPPPPPAAIAAPPAPPPAKPEIEDATIISETVTAGPSPAEAQAADASPVPPPVEGASAAEPDEVGINPDDELANLIDKLAHAQDEATVEEWYAETDIEAALGEFTGYVEKARAIKAQQISRVQAIAERAAKAAEPAAPPPPASTGLADDEEVAAPPPLPAMDDKCFDMEGWRDIAAKQPYIGYADLLAGHAKTVGDAKLIETFWADSKAKRTELITEADERLALLKRLNGVIDEINIANGRAAHGA